jgi:hypothetical protein
VVDKIRESSVDGRVVTGENQSTQKSRVYFMVVVFQPKILKELAQN